MTSDRNQTPARASQEKSCIWRYIAQERAQSRHCDDGKGRDGWELRARVKPMQASEPPTRQKDLFSKENRSHPFTRFQRSITQTPSYGVRHGRGSRNQRTVVFDPRNPKIQMSISSVYFFALIATDTTSRAVRRVAIITTSWGFLATALRK